MLSERRAALQKGTANVKCAYTRDYLAETFLHLQEWLAREDGGTEEAGRHAAAASPCLFTRTPSLEQAGGLQRMTLRGHTGGISKVLLTPGGIDVITGARLSDCAVQDGKHNTLNAQ